MTWRSRDLHLYALVLGAVGCAAGALIDPRALLAAWLPVAVTLIAISSGCLGVLMMTYLVPGRWVEDLHRPLTAAALSVPLAGLLLVPVFLAMTWLYPWASEPPETAFKALYLTPWFFLLRSVLYILIWSLLALWMRNAFGNVPAMRRAASVGLVVFALTGSLAGVDWLESVNPAFHSSIYGFLFLTSQFLAGVAFGLFVLLVNRPSDSVLRAGYGALLLSTLLLWAYNHAMQYIIVWAGNIPEEMRWYVDRLANGWGWALWGLFMLQFIVPFFVMLSAEMRASRAALLIICGATLALRFLEAFVLVLPDLDIGGAALFIDIPATILLAGSLWLFAFLRTQRRVDPAGARAGAAHRGV